MVIFWESLGRECGKKNKFGERVNVLSVNCGVPERMSLACAKDFPAICPASVLVSSVGISDAFAVRVALIVPSFVDMSFTE